MEAILNKYQKILQKKYKLRSIKITNTLIHNINYKVEWVIEGKNGDQNLFEFTISQFPGCCGIAVLNHLNKNWHHSKSELVGIGVILVDFAVELCIYDEYGYMMVTDKEDGNGKELIEKLKYKFIPLDKFFNPGSKNNVKIWLLNLNQ